MGSSRPFILLFGDSITEQGFGMNGKVGWASLLAADYSRRADVWNRGYFGYNSKHAVDLLPSLPLDNSPLFTTVYFGANDATTPGSRQYIPESKFASNLTQIVTTIRAKTKPEAPIILMTPPPLHQSAWANFKGLDNRSNERHQLYGSLVKEVAANQRNCSCLDVWKLLEGDTTPQVYGKYLTDGLHLNEQGNHMLYQGLTELIQKEHPALAPQQQDGKGIPLEGKLWEELC